MGDSYSDSGCRYPRSLEMFRLEALGDRPYYDDEEARARFDAQRGLTVVEDREPPTWRIEIAAKYTEAAADFAWFEVTYFTTEKTPLREVMWRRVGEDLFCRSVIDVFYPEGDPKGRVRFADVVTVRQEFSTDGVVLVTRRSPIEGDVVHEVDGVPVDGHRLPVPRFGEWGALLMASAPEEMTRFGWEALDAADEYARRCAAGGVARAADDPNGGWRIGVTAPGVVAAVRSVVEGDTPQGPVPVLERGAARIVPLMVQPDPRVSGRDPWEDRHRFETISDEVVEACEFAFGRQATPPALDLDRQGEDAAGAYAAALRAAGATRAVWWTSDGRGIVLVLTGDELHGDLTSAIHIVPEGWVAGRATAADAQRLDLGWSRDDVADHHL